MTQLDSVTWFPQVFWLFAIFFSIFTLIYTIFGPLSFYNQNLRFKKIENHYKSIVSLNFLNVDTKFKRYSIISNNF